MTDIEFKPFPKMPRLSRDCIVTEKIDGTNAQILITPDGKMLYGSRSRWITPDDDNYGFARWATEHRDELMALGVGRHFGEWWGSGIQRGYGLPKGYKRFSLFNVARWCPAGETPKLIPQADPRIQKYQDMLPSCCDLVPILGHGSFDTISLLAASCLAQLESNGSLAAPGFMQPEGIVVFHVAGNCGFKKTIVADDRPKSL